MSIIQNPLPPYTMRCTACGHQWTPTPARGTTAVTANRLDTETTHHFTTCKPTTPATIGPS